MGKKYIPVKINNMDYRVYLDNVEKVYKVSKKNIPSIPSFSKNTKRTLLRKASIHTEPGSPLYASNQQFPLSA